jgi:hypothetical protein
MSDLQPVFSGEMQLMNWGESSANGAWVKFWITPEDLEAFRSLKCKSGKIAGHRVAAVLVEIGDDELPVQRAPEAEKANDYGQHYAVLYKSGWFHNPKVVTTLGVPATFAPDERIEAIKQLIYEYFDVDSLAKVPPNAFKGYCYEAGILATLPAAFGGV